MGRIILPRREIITPKFHVHTGMAGLYRLQVRKARTDKLKYDTGWFDNLITNQGLINYYTMPNFGAFDRGAIACNCAVGTGNTTPTVNDTALANFVAAASGTGATGGGTGFPQPNATGYVAAAGSVPAYWFMTYIYQFATGVAAGNLTEVGAYPGGTSYTDSLTSRALILDDAGNPTAITVLSDEILTVTYQLRFYLDTSDHSFSFNLNGSPITGTYRLYGITSTPSMDVRTTSAAPAIELFSGAMGTVTSRPTGSLGGIGSSSNAPTLVQTVNDIANSGTVYMDWKGTFPTSIGAGTIASFTYTAHMWKYQFGALSSPIIKTAGQQLQVNFRASWGRYTP